MGRHLTLRCCSGNLVPNCQQCLQRPFSDLTRLFPRAELGAGFFHWKNFMFGKNFPGISFRSRTPVFYFHSKMACDG